MSEQIVQRCMVDTCVLQYALLSLMPHKSLPVSSKPLVEASAELLRQLKRIKVSAISWAEINRNLRLSDANALGDFHSRITIIPVSAEAAKLSATLLTAKTGHDKTCSRCLNSLQTTPCKQCKAKLPKSSHLADALILATAELRRDIDVLYTADAGFGFYQAESLIQSCTIRRPPNPHGPLFERAAAADEASL